MLQQLREKLGDSKARTYLLDFFKDEANLPYWLALFPEHFDPGLGVPDHELEILGLIPRFSRLGIAGPRGSGKSTVLNVGVVSFYALNRIFKYSLIVSDTLTQSEAHLDALKVELETNELINWLYGNVVGTYWGVGGIELRTPYGMVKVQAKGRGQKIRGLKWRSYRPELVVVDDFEDLEMLDSPTITEKAKRWFEFDLLRALSKETNKVVVLGTILSEHCLLNDIIKKRTIFGGWETRKYVAIKPDRISYWPEKFSISYLEAIRDNPLHPEYCGSLVFAQEYQNEPRSDADKIIKDGWLKYYSLEQKKRIDEEWFDGLRITGCADPAIGEEASAHYFTINMVGIDKDGHYWSLDIVREKGISTAEQVTLIVDMLLKWKPSAFGIESNAYQDALRQLVIKEMGRRKVHLPIKKILTDKKKERRAMIHAAKFEGGFVHLQKDHPLTQALVGEIRTFPAEPDDTFDSLLLVLDMDVKTKSRAFVSKPKGF